MVEPWLLVRVAQVRTLPSSFMADDTNGSANVIRALMRALRASETNTETAQKAGARARGWMDFLTNIASEAMRAGIRPTFNGTPRWVTLPAWRGRASGQYTAGGALLPHELARAAELGLPLDKKSRDALHADSLSQDRKSVV